MNKAEETIRMSLELCLGYEWGDPRSLVEQTDENKELWEMMADHHRQAAEKGYEIVHVSEWSELTDADKNNIY